MTTSDPDDNTSVPSRPVKATPEQLREQLWAIMMRRNQKILEAQKTDALVLPYFEADDEAATEILALFATFLASIELPDKQNEREKGINIHLDNQRVGFNRAIDHSQAIIDNVIKEFKG